MRASEFDKHPELGNQYWGSDREYPLSVWVDEVSNDDTRLGYWDWVLSQREQAAANNQTNQ